MAIIINEQSGNFNKVGGRDFPSSALIKEHLFSYREAFQPDALVCVSLSDVCLPNGKILEDQLLIVWQFDDGAIVFGAYESLYKPTLILSS